jgi:hypothetical protein
MAKYSCIIFFLLTSCLYSQGFRNGAHLINNDDKSYTIKYTEYTLSTRICNCTKPTPNIKNGLVAASMRNEIKGFHIISSIDTSMIGGTEITASIAPNTKIHCLSVNMASLEIAGIGNIESPSDKTIIITNGKITVIPAK